MSDIKTTLQQDLPLLQLPLTEEAVEKLAAFGELVIEKNKVMNLTAITEPEAVAQLHLLDSLTLLKALPLKGKAVLDVGTGAGFPGVPLKIAEPDIRLTLLDSLQKRMNWLENEALPSLNVSARFLTGRAEDFAQTNRGLFDVVTSRAVARLNILCELCLPFVKKGGYFAAMKGEAAEEELLEARKAISILGGSFECIETYEIGGALHRIILIKKTDTTPPQYPRAYARIKQKPL